MQDTRQCKLSHTFISIRPGYMAISGHEMTAEAPAMFHMPPSLNGACYVDLEHCAVVPLEQYRVWPVFKYRFRQTRLGRWLRPAVAMVVRKQSR